MVPTKIGLYNYNGHKFGISLDFCPFYGLQGEKRHVFDLGCGGIGNRESGVGSRK
ncbi:hypothetical protein [Spirulina subsalsa]|uniref:hypothetical protein n=1 Tax=Spirulina subsalsa TaxID=54311 RepID=UPI0013DE7BE6|nr:hypothetical protein [Spirulina subsalsa]